MGKLWSLMGPDEDVLYFKDAAKLFGYEPKSLRQLIAEGRFPAPRGFGQNTYYTGDDVAAIRLLLGRWQPQDEPPDEDAENVAKVPKTGVKGRKSAEVGETQP